MYRYDKDEIKNSLSIEQVYDLIESLGGEPILRDNYIISRTICHNPAGCGSYKLYYYANTRLCRCYTECEGDAFDVFELVRKQKTISNGVQWTLYMAVEYVASYFGFSASEYEEVHRLNDWDILERYEKLNDIQINQQKAELKHFDDTILNNLPKVRIPAWEKEGILPEVMKHRNIAYDPINEGIVIPHYDIEDNLIGIRERTLIKEREAYGKYRPAILNGIMFNHSLMFNLYNINNSKNNIKALKTAIVFESEKATMQYESFFGADNDISVATCGSSLLSYQVKLLLSLGVKEIIVAFDKQYRELGDEESKRWVKKLKEIHKKYSPYALVSFIFDKYDLLGYKEAPTDRGKEIFLELFERRIIL